MVPRGKVPLQVMRNLTKGKKPRGEGRAGQKIEQQITGG